MKFNFTLIYIQHNQTMNTSQDQDFHIPKAFNRSCKEKILVDPISSQSEEDEYQKSVRSQEGVNTFKRWDILEQLKKEWIKTEGEKKQMEKAKQSKLETQFLASKKKKIDNKLNFGTQVLESQSVSIDEQEYARINDIEPQKQQKNTDIKSQKVERLERNRQPRKKMYLNLLLLGRSGTGKTSFSDSFCNRKYETIYPIRERTQAIQISSFRDQREDVQISLIDIPGYQELRYQAYTELVERFLVEKLQKHIQATKGKKNSLNKIQTDFRVHCCLFFLSGPWPSDIDWAIIKRIQPLVNIIPIIAKGDSYTSTEIRHFKKQISQKNRALNIKDFSIQEYLRQSYPQKLERLLSGSFGKAPPFVITCCNQKYYNDKTKTHDLYREYKWGRCELDNDEHNDFKFLKLLLTNYLVEFLVNSTDVLEKSFIEQQIEIKKYEKREFISENSVDITDQNQNVLNSGSKSEVKDEGAYEMIKNIMFYGTTVVGLYYVYALIKKQSK